MSKKSKTDNEIVEIKLQKYTAGVLKQAVRFLEIFLPKTLAKRFVVIILLATGSLSKPPLNCPDYPKEVFGHSIRSCRSQVFPK